jgi:DNA-binding transcriptional LysR family regulator
MKLTLEALQLLDAIDVRGSFAAAAEELHRVPSAVTHAIRRLEEDLGVTLFDRAGRRSVPTAAGRALLEEGRHLLRAAGDLECRVKRVATGWESALTIAVDASIDPVRLFPLIAAFDREAGGTRLRLNEEVLGGSWDAIVTGRADFAVGAPGEPPPGGGWSVRTLGPIEFVFAVAPQHPLAQAAEPLTAQAVAGHRVIVLADTSRELLSRTAGLVSDGNTLTVSDGNVKTEAIVAGLGVGHVPRIDAERLVAAGKLVIKPLAEPMPPVMRHLAWRTQHEGKALAWFVERLDTPEWKERLLAA